MGASMEFQSFGIFLEIICTSFFKNHVKYQKMGQSNIRIFITDVKFHAKHDPADRKN